MADAKKNIDVCVESQYSECMITDVDVKKLKAVFATKGDIKSTISTTFDQKLKPIKNSIKKIQETLNLSIKLSENQHKQHFQRLTKIEEKLGIEKSDFISSN